MKPRSKRAIAIVCGLVLLGGATALVLKTFNSNLVFFYSPSQVAKKEAPINRSFRLGGLVEQGSLTRDPEGLTVHFVVTDQITNSITATNSRATSWISRGTVALARGHVPGRGRGSRQHALACLL